MEILKSPHRTSTIEYILKKINNEDLTNIYNKKQYKFLIKKASAGGYIQILDWGENITKQHNISQYFNISSQLDNNLKSNIALLPDTLDMNFAANNGHIRVLIWGATRKKYIDPDIRSKDNRFRSTSLGSSIRLTASGVLLCKAGVKPGYVKQSDKRLKSPSQQEFNVNKPIIQSRLSLSDSDKKYIEMMNNLKLKSGFTTKAKPDQKLNNLKKTHYNSSIVNPLKKSHDFLNYSLTTKKKITPQHLNNLSQDHQLTKIQTVLKKFNKIFQQTSVSSSVHPDQPTTGSSNVRIQLRKKSNGISDFLIPLNFSQQKNKLIKLTPINKKIKPQIQVENEINVNDIKKHITPRSSKNTLDEVTFSKTYSKIGAVRPTVNDHHLNTFSNLTIKPLFKYFGGPILPNYIGMNWAAFNNHLHILIWGADQSDPILPTARGMKSAKNSDIIEWGKQRLFHRNASGKIVEGPILAENDFYL
ncbi:MAG: hypothetical protein JKX76_02455 [Colwellia sp.]|nr:hypothetical protein [Colwellia sp.]